MPESGSSVLVPVPRHRQGERERRYNQATVLFSKPLAKRLRLTRKAFPITRA